MQSFAKLFSTSLALQNQMSHDIQLKADVGTLSLQGLSAFFTILATLSADNILPMALVQMEKLGSAFSTTGEYAERVKSLLQRCGDVRLNHLAIVVGWRKNDSASLMAESAGGQAIALVSMCLMNLFGHPDSGTILTQLCSRLLSDSMNVSSVSQLADVAKLLTGKLDTLGFGNLLAREVSKIHQVYTAIGIAAPQDLLEPLDTESATEILVSVSRALCEDQKICRIAGSQGMGHILGLIQALFHRSTVVIVESTIIQDVESARIYCEISQSDRLEPTQIHLETSILTSTPVDLPITVLQTTSKKLQLLMPYRFNWSGGLADLLQLTFLNYGFNCDQAILDACCNLLILIPTAVNIEPTVSLPTRNHERLQPAPLIALLGPLPRARMCKICEEILRSRPTIAQMDLNTAFAKLKAVVATKVQGLSCVCPEGSKCNSTNGWLDNNRREKEKKKHCVQHCLWDAIGCTLSNALWCFFINTGPNAVICPEAGVGVWCITNVVTGKEANISAERLMTYVMTLVGQRWDQKGLLALSSDSCTIYPTILRTLSVPPHQFVTFTLVEGQLVYERRYHRYLRAKPARARPKATTTLQKDNIRPSHIGVHLGSPLLTLREGFDFLEFICTFRFAGNDIKVNLEAVILGYIGMRWTDMCSHPVTDSMDLSKHASIPTSVASPSAFRRFGVAMTRWSPVAQFLCCENGYQAVLQKNCCLNCASEGLAATAHVVIIVG